MLATTDRSPHIGVRELRQNASRYLELVEAGDTLDVTRNGKVVARLVPVERADEDPLAELLATGVLRLPEDRGDLLDVIPAVSDNPTAVSEALAALRAEDRW
jgi:prevent-host-death family protein